MSEETTPKVTKRNTPKKQSNKDISTESKKFRLERLTIQNFKAFDDFTIEFPAPIMKDDPDIVIIGSSNGVGKTTILEACSLLFLAATINLPDNDFNMPMELLNLIIRAKAENIQLTGAFASGNEIFEASLKLSPTWGKIVVGDLQELQKLMGKSRAEQSYTKEAIRSFFLSLTGANSDPLILPSFLYFHSYRRVQEGKLELGTLVADASLKPLAPIGAFKLEILRSLMSRGGLFESFEVSDAEEILETLDMLMKEFAGVSIGKLRPSIGSEVEFRVIPVSGNSKPSFSFDGLSSGQKEIISTLFLIWHYTRKRPSIVLIDEPELHLNAEWHRKFIRYLNQLAPDNQYIIATHSEDIVAAVDKDHRILLVPDDEEV